MHNIRWFFKRLKHVLKWSRYLWRDNDFEAFTLYTIIEYKLREIEKGMVVSEHEGDEKNRKAIRIAIKLANRLANAYHEDKLHSRHDKRWGKSQWHYSPDEKKDFVQVHMTREKILTESDYQQERSDFKAMYTKMHWWGPRDRKLLFDIMNKYIDHWWC